MRRLAVLSLLTAAVAAPLAAPAAATCRPVVDRYGVLVATCAAPGGEPWYLVCYRDTCVA